MLKIGSGGRFSKLSPKPVIGLVGCMAENYKDGAFENAGDRFEG